MTSTDTTTNGDSTGDNDPNNDSSRSLVHHDHYDSIQELQQANLLRLQMDETVQACHLEISEDGWVKKARDFLSYTQQILEQVAAEAPNTPLKPTPNCPFVFTSDRAVQLESLNLKIHVPILHRDDASVYTQPAGNGRVLPTFDIHVLLRNTMLDGKDILRHRYLDKRKLVVWHTAQELARRHPYATVYWEYQNADPLKPRLLLVPKTITDVKKKFLTKKLRYRIQIHFGMESLDWIYSKLRLLPNRCNLAVYDNNNKTQKRQSWMTTRSESVAYNNVILEDYYNAQDTVGTTSKNAIGAVVLLQIWSLQRGLLRNHDGWTTQHISLLVTYLFRTKQVNERMALPHVLAAFFRLVVETDWLGEENEEENAGGNRVAPSRDATNGFFLGLSKAKRRHVLCMPRAVDEDEEEEAELSTLYEKEPVAEQQPATLLEFYKEHLVGSGAVFLDASMTINYASRWSPSFIRCLQQEAKRSQPLLNDFSNSSSFDLLFRTTARFWQKHDCYMHIPISCFMDQSQRLEQTLSGVGIDNITGCASSLGSVEFGVRAFESMLKLSLGCRVKSIRTLSTGNEDLCDSNGLVDSDGVRRFPVTDKDVRPAKRDCSPTGTQTIVVGFSLDPDNCHQMVDRGPADNDSGAKAFQELWGNEKAHLRRFKDGSIVLAVVWGLTENNEDVKDEASYQIFSNDDRIQGGIVERITRHVIRLHFAPHDLEARVQFQMRNMMSLVDNRVNPSLITSEASTSLTLLNPFTAHRKIMNAFERLADFLRTNSRETFGGTGGSSSKCPLGIPLTIDAVEAVAPALRYSALYPPLPHSQLGGQNVLAARRVSGAISFDPIEIQIRFSGSSKWPVDSSVAKTVKTALLAQLAKGIEDLTSRGVGSAHDFEGPIRVSRDYADIPFMGYVFRVFVQSDPDIPIRTESTRQNENLLLFRASHHALMHALYTRYPSSSFTVRLASKWLASHLISDLIPFEAVELLVCYAYTENHSPLGSPGGAVAGFMRFLRLLAHFEWDKLPMIVDPNENMSREDMLLARKRFEDDAQLEGSTRTQHLFLAAPRSRITDLAEKQQTIPFLTIRLAENVVFNRICSLALKSLQYLERLLKDQKEEDADAWQHAFRTPLSSYRAFDAVIRVDRDLLVDTSSSSTEMSPAIEEDRNGRPLTLYMRSMLKRFAGPKQLCEKVHRNLSASIRDSILLEWNPVEEVVMSLRERLGHTALFFYNKLCPEVITVLFRPDVRESRGLSVLQSEFTRPLPSGNWKADSLVRVNTSDIVREIQQCAGGIFAEVKILSLDSKEVSSKKRRRLST